MVDTNELAPPHRHRTPRPSVVHGLLTVLHRAAEAMTGWADRRPRLARGLREAAIATAFLALAVFLRGSLIGTPTEFSPDEAELMAQARAAMGSPVPFTTWTTATTGPVWPLFLALLGVLGLPLTLAFAHLLSSLLFGVLAYLSFMLARPRIGVAQGLVLALLCWLPLVVVAQGALGDMGSLATELLPSVLVVLAALVPNARLARNPWLYFAIGVLCGLAVAAKYQVVPLALAVLVVQLGLVGDSRWRVMLRSVALYTAGALAPIVAVVVAVMLSPGTSVIVGQTVNFLGSYAGRSTNHRLSNWLHLVTSDHVIVMSVVVLWLAAMSAARVRIWRAVYVSAGLVAVFAGGMLFPHYLIFTYAAIAMAVGLPLRPGAKFLPFVRRRDAAVVVVLTSVLAWILSVGPTLGLANRLNRSELMTALSAQSGPRDAKLATACPEGSDVVVWGWAPELYVHYSWNNAIPYFNVILLTGTPTNFASGYDVIQDAIEDESTDCVVDATGWPFFDFYSEPPSLLSHYPAIAEPLDGRYRSIGAVLKCQSCTVYVRR